MLCKHSFRSVTTSHKICEISTHTAVYQKFEKKIQNVGWIEMYYTSSLTSLVRIRLSVSKRMPR